jgi:hypothetical protein
MRRKITVDKGIDDALLQLQRAVEAAKDDVELGDTRVSMPRESWGDIERALALVHSEAQAVVQSLRYRPAEKPDEKTEDHGLRLEVDGQTFEFILIGGQRTGTWWCKWKQRGTKGAAFYTIEDLRAALEESGDTFNHQK